jgi:hypothetical protein
VISHERENSGSPGRARRGGSGFALGA